jgi:hypothetical protein
MTLKDITAVFRAENILNTNCRHNGYTPSDLSDKEYAEEVYKIITDKKYRKQLLVENRG